MKPLFLRYGDEDEASQCKNMVITMITMKPLFLRYGDKDEASQCQGYCDNDETIVSKIWW